MSLTARRNVKIQCLSDLVREKQKKPDDEPMEIDEPMDCSFPTINKPIISSSVNAENVLPNYISDVSMSPIRRKINGFEYWMYMASSESKVIPLPSYQRLAAIPDDFFDHSYHDSAVHSTPTNDGIIISSPKLNSINALSNQSEDQRHASLVRDNIANNLNPVIHENFDLPHLAHPYHHGGPVVHSTPTNDGRIIPPPELSSINALSNQSEDQRQNALVRDNIANSLNPVIHENFDLPHLAQPYNHGGPVVHSTPANDGIIVPPPELSSINPLSDQSEDQRQNALNLGNILLPSNLNPVVHENFDLPHLAHPYNHGGPVVHSTPTNDGRIIPPPELSSINALSNQSEDQRQASLVHDNIANNLNPVIHDNFDVPHLAHPYHHGGPVVHSTPANDGIIVPTPELSSINPLSDQSEIQRQNALNLGNILLPSNLNPVVHENSDTPKLPRPIGRSSAPPFNSLLDLYKAQNDNID